MAEPAISQVQVHFLAQPPLRANAIAVTEDQHAQHHLGVNRWSAGMAVEWGKGFSKLVQIEKGIDLTKQVVLRDVIFQAKLIKQGILVRRQLTHHRHRSLSKITAANYPMNPNLQGVFQYNILKPYVQIPALSSEYQTVCYQNGQNYYDHRKGCTINIYLARSLQRPVMRAYGLLV